MILLNPSEYKELVQTLNMEDTQELKNIRKMLKNYFKDDAYNLEDIIIHHKDHNHKDQNIVQ